MNRKYYPLLAGLLFLNQGRYGGDSARILNDYYALRPLQQDFYRFIPATPIEALTELRSQNNGLIFYLKPVFLNF